MNRLLAIRLALAYLRAARNLLHQAKAPRSLARVRAALKSAEGAERHAKNDESRAERRAITAK